MQQVIGFPLPKKLEDSAYLAVLCKGLLEGAAAAAAHLRGTFPFPSLYQSGVRYRTEQSSEGIEQFCFPWDTFSRGYGDCEDLCIWRLAELLSSGEKASISVEWQGNFLHIQIRRENGSLEDPSERLGMK